MAFRATPCKVGILLDTGKPHKPLCCVFCRNVRTVEGGNRKREVVQKHRQANLNKSSEKLEVYQTSGNVAAVGSNEQTVAQWAKLRDTVSGLRASVGSISRSWKSDNPKTDQKTKEVKNKVETSEKTSNENSVGNNEAVKETTYKQYLYMNKEGEAAEFSARWVDQILEIQEDREKELNKLDDITKLDDSMKQAVTEKLDDPLAETNTQPLKKQSEQSAKSSGITSKMTFSYFSRNNSENTKPALLKKVSKNNMKAKEDEQVTSSASTIDWIRGAVGLSAAKKNVSNAASVEDSLESLKAKVIESAGKDVIVSKTTNGPDTDKSYWNVLSNLQQSILVSLSLSNAPKPAADSPENIAKNIMHSELESESAFAMRTVSLSDNLVAAESNMSKTKRLDEFCLHLTQHPQFRHIAMKVRFANACYASGKRVLTFNRTIASQA